MFSVSIEVKTKAWIKNPKRRWQAGLEGAGMRWRQNLQRAHYGVAPGAAGGSTYARTGTLANKSNFVFPKGEGVEVDFVSTMYLRFLLFGTGLYGPKHQLIRPGNVMAWTNTGNISVLTSSGGIRAAGHGSKGVPRTMFSMTSKGSIWAGKRQELIAEVIKGFTTGIKNYKD